MAVGEKNPTITRAIFGSDIQGTIIGPAVGIIIYNTVNSEWTIKTYAPLPYSDYDLYFPTLTGCPPIGRYVDKDCYRDALVGFADGIRSEDGRIEATGNVCYGNTECIEFYNTLIEDRGVFILTTNGI